MEETPPSLSPLEFAHARVPRWRRWMCWAWQQRLFVLGIIVLTTLLACTLLAPKIAPYSPIKPDYETRLAAPSSEHWFGTDEHGRDIFTRILYGAAVTFMISAVAVGISAGVGVPLGMLAGFFGGWFDTVISRVVDGMFAFPGILLALALMTVLGPGETGAMIAIGIVAIPVAARVARSAVLAEMGNEYVEASRALGSSWIYIVFRSILPNALGPIVVLVSLSFAQAVLSEAALSFLGLGAQPPKPAWGLMLAVGRRYLGEAPWYIFFPGLFIFLLVFSMNSIGEGLRDLVDPRRERF